MTTRLHFDACDSTNAYLLRRAGELPHLAVVTADRQSAGHGRFGRPWLSVPGNHLLSVLFKLPLPVVRLPLLNILAPLALHTALAPLAPGLAIKWPNDLLRRGRKVAGVLVETSVAGGRLEHAALGFGVNAAGVPEGIEGARTEPGDLSECPACRDRERVVAGVLTGLTRYIAGSDLRVDDILRDFSAALDPAARVRFLLADGSPLDARVVGVTAEGAPLVAGDDGAPAPLPAGAGLA